MKNSQRKSSKVGCVLAPPAWRLGVLVVIEIVVVVLLCAGYDLSVALPYAAGGGMVAAYVARCLLDLPHTVRVAR